MKINLENLNQSIDSKPPDPYAGDMRSDLKKIPDEARMSILRMLETRRIRKQLGTTSSRIAEQTAQNTPPPSNMGPVIDKDKDKIPGWLKRQAWRHGIKPAEE